MTPQTKTNIKQIVGILVGLVVVYFGYQLLALVSGLLANIVFTFLLIIVALVIFGVISNPFRKSVNAPVNQYNENNQPFPLEPDTTVPTTKSVNEHEI
jgi:ABC-type bacteriocin/lantibiotic exporter with double-glycine peptidase domain